MNRLLHTCLGLLAIVLAAAQARAEITVSAVRLGLHVDKTRFVMELSEAPAYRVFTLPDPFRVVLDLPALGWNLTHEGVPSALGLVSALRFGLFAPGTSRVVLDVKAPVGLRGVFVMPPSGDRPYRLVIDLQEISREAFFSAEAQAPIASKAPLPSVKSSALPVPPPKPEVDSRRTIVIDAGHGGIDPGSVGPTGRLEKQLTLAYAQELKRQLEAGGRYRVAFTRNKDIFIRLRDRIARAQDAGGDLFVSLHADTHDRKSLRGSSVYTLSDTASDAEAEALAARENKSDIIAGINLSDQSEAVSKILIDLAQRETMNLSRNFANMLVEQLVERIRLLPRPHRFADFAVLKSPTIPSVLVELGYMSNKAEEKLLHSEGHRRELSGAITRAIDEFFGFQQAEKRI